VHNYHDTYKTLPAGRWSFPTPVANGGNGLTWLVGIMPFIEQSNGFELFDLTKYYSNEVNAEQTNQARQVRVPSYTCPTRRNGSELSIQEDGRGDLLGSGGQLKRYYKPGAVGDYAGNVGSFDNDIPSPPWGNWWTVRANGVIIAGINPTDGTNKVIPQLNFAKILDGTSNTFMAGEKHVPIVGLYHVDYGDASCYNAYYIPNHSRMAGIEDPLALGPGDVILSTLGNGQLARRFGSWHPGVCGFALADGSVRHIRNNMSTTVLQSLARRDDGVVANVD
jgi:hypothetical protein